MKEKRNVFKDEKKRELAQHLVYRQYRNSNKSLAHLWDQDKHYVESIQEQFSEEEFEYLKKIIKLIPEDELTTPEFVFQLLTTVLAVRNVAQDMSLANNTDWEAVLALRSLEIKDWSHG
jgi:hypothetical protein